MPRENHVSEQPPHQPESENNREFETISTPEELLSFMGREISYGFIGRNSKVVYSHDHPKMHDAFTEEYFLQTPEELLTSRHGVCWDSTELERRWFSEHGYQPKTYFLAYLKEDGTNLPTHTFVVYEKDKKWFWFEHAFNDQRGLHEYPDLETLLADVKTKHHEYAKKHRGATDTNFDNLQLTEYQAPEFGSSPSDFVNHVLKQNKSK